MEDDFSSVIPLFQFAASLGVHIAWGILPQHWLGEYDRAKKTITLAKGALRSSATLRTVIAHELGHAANDLVVHMGDDSEREADHFAIRFLIRFDDYQRARRMYGGNYAMMAKALDVLPWVLREYERSCCSADLYRRIDATLKM